MPNSVASQFQELLNSTGIGRTPGRSLTEEFWSMLSGTPIPRVERIPQRPEHGGPPAPGVDWDYDRDAWRRQAFGKRADGTDKGSGFFGPLLSADKKWTMSEYSIGVSFNGKELEIPTMVPTLTKKELQSILDNPQDKVSSTIMKKAVAHARERLSQGKSPFAEEGEQRRVY